MDGSLDLAGRIGAMATGSVLLVPGAIRIARRTEATDALVENLQVGGAVAATIAVCTAVVESVLGMWLLGGAMGLVGDRPYAIGLAAAIALLAVYTAYLLYLLIARDGAPCGCDSSKMSTSPWTVARTLSFLGFAGLGLITLGLTDLSMSTLRVQATMMVPAAFSLSLIVWHLPKAMAMPDTRRAL
jgi:hypothetical protein